MLVPGWMFVGLGKVPGKSKLKKKRQLGKYILGIDALNYMDIYENVLLGTQQCVYEGGVCVGR